VSAVVPSVEPHTIAPMRAALLALVFTLTATAPAHATLVFERGQATTSVWVANDDGSGAKRLVTGSQPHVSRDGKTVVYVSGAGEESPQLREIPAAGGASRPLVRNLRFGAFAWSADGRYVAAQTGPLNGRQRLTLIDRTSGTARTVARGAFYGWSFSPASDQLVYARADRDALFPATDLEVAATAGGLPRILTQDGRAMYPLWGPQQLAYVRYRHPERRGDGPKFNLWLLNPDGTGRRRLTNDRVPFLLTGLTPTAWSADGTRLLAEFGGQDTAYAVTVDPATGAERVVGAKSQGFLASALSADGSTILGSSGGFEWPGPARIVTAPYTGGATRVLVARGQSPDWSR
jgi:Tol biopolymer transport system component